MRADLLIALAGTVLLAGEAAAQAYKCTDAKGRTQYSDRPCEGVSRSTVTTYGPSAGPTNAAPGAGGPDEALVARCLEHLRASQAWVDRESLRLEGTPRFEWVGVRDVGARRMLHLTINARNESGGYGGPRPYRCLIRGDNENIHTGPYELVSPK